PCLSNRRSPGPGSDSWREGRKRRARRFDGQVRGGSQNKNNIPFMIVAANTAVPFETIDMNSPESFDQAGSRPEPLQARVGEAVETARETISSAGSTLLQWVRENPATALAGI